MKACFGRTGDELNQTNSVIHSFASKIYLEALEPENESVGRYEIVMEATDLAGERVSQSLGLVIANAMMHRSLMPMALRNPTYWFSG